MASRDRSEDRVPPARGSLRAGLTRALAGIATLTLVLAGALVFITTEMHALTRSLQRAAAADQELDGARASLLVASRTGDDVTWTAMRRAAASALELPAGLASERTAREARAALDAYFDALASGAPPERREVALARAGAALDALSDEVTAAATGARAAVVRWDRLANLLGVGGAGVLAAAVLSLLWWVRAHAFRPMLALAGAMHRYAAGDPAARAPVDGPAELAATARQFNAMADALARRREQQLAFLAGVAHDLRNPLSALRLAVRAHPPDAPLAPEARIRRTLGLVDRQVERLERMLTDLLDGARVESGHLDLRLAPTDLRRLSEEVVALFAESSAQHRVRLEAVDLVITCDPVRVEQVLVNLLSNAIKYSPSGGEVVVALAPAGDAARLSVSDEGIGVAPAEVEAIFQPFRRSDRVRDVPGSGLGLSVVRRIVESHGGSVSLEARPGGGSRFSVLLPREPGAGARSDAGAPPAAGAPASAPVRRHA